MRQEEILWHQKSRTKRITNRDRNIDHYHTKTIVHRSRNKINMLRNSEGRWIDRKEELLEMITGFYKNLFG